jgi:hypothetical protein
MLPLSPLCLGNERTRRDENTVSFFPKKTKPEFGVTV